MSRKVIDKYFFYSNFTADLDQIDFNRKLQARLNNGKNEPVMIILEEAYDCLGNPLSNDFSIYLRGNQDILKEQIAIISIFNTERKYLLKESLLKALPELKSKTMNTFYYEYEMYSLHFTKSEITSLSKQLMGSDLALNKKEGALIDKKYLSNDCPLSCHSEYDLHFHESVPRITKAAYQK